jgi:hypothetical protein
MAAHDGASSARRQLRQGFQTIVVFLNARPLALSIFYV